MILQPVAIDLSEGSPYSVYFPNLPGCNAIGNSVEEALENAKEAATDHIEILINDREDIPSSVNTYRGNSPNCPSDKAAVMVAMPVISPFEMV